MVAVLISNMPSIGKKMMGNNAVTGMGIASVTHQITIQTAMATTNVACGLTAEKSKITFTRMNDIGPERRETRYLIFMVTVYSKNL